MSDGKYVSVRCFIREVRRDAVLVSVTVDGCGIWEWVPRRLIRPEDAAALTGAFSGEIRTIGIEAWKAEALGFVTRRAAAAASGDLFEGNRK